MKLTTLKKSVATVTTLAIAMTGLAFAAAPAAHASLGCSMLEAAPQSFTAVIGVDWNVPMSAGDTVTATWSNLSDIAPIAPTATVNMSDPSGELTNNSISPGETVVLSHVLSTDAASISTTLMPITYGEWYAADVTLSCVQAPVESQVITFDAFPDSFTTVANVELTATASSGLPVAYVTTTLDVCGITTSGGTSSVLINTAGTCTVTASQPGGNNGGTEYLPASDVTRDLTITKAAPYIEFTTVTDQLLSAGTVTVDATADVTTPSGTTTVGAVESFTSLTTEVCTVQAPLASSATVNLLDVGTCTIQADRAADASYLAASGAISFGVSNAVSPPPAVDAGSANLPAGVVGLPYSATVAASGGQAPFQWSLVSGSLPEGLSLNLSTGQISGTPTTEETQTATILLTDSRPASQGGEQRVQVAYTIAILDELVITTPSLLPAVQGQAYTQTLTAEGGNGNYTWVVASGALPSGLTLSTDGVVSGTPDTVESVSFTIQVTDTAGVTGSRSLPMPVATAGVTIVPTVQASSGTVNNITGTYDFDLGGTCVGGDCSYGSNGSYSFGEPGTYILMMLSPDSENNMAITTYSITVFPAVAIPLETVQSTQSINFPSVVDDATTLTASASSGLTVEFTTVTAAVCTVTGSTVTPVTSGDCSIEANQPGDVNYLAATPVVQSFTVNAAASPAPTPPSGGGGSPSNPGASTPAVEVPAVEAPVVEAPVVVVPPAAPAAPVERIATSTVEVRDICVKGETRNRYTFNVTNNTSETKNINVKFHATDQRIKVATAAKVSKNREVATWKGLRLKAGQTAPLMVRTTAPGCGELPKPVVTSAVTGKGSELKVQTVRWRQNTGDKWRVVKSNRKLWRTMPDGIFFSVVYSPEAPFSKNTEEGMSQANKLAKLYAGVNGGETKGLNLRGDAIVIGAWVGPIK